MRFTRLKLNGFKSFVDPTDLVIADGLTGVVGPNGCGKSNLLEALRWVMGENRPTAMRGGGMEDVIFAGAASRPARNFAEVSLHIDNGERLAPSGFNDSDVLEVVRRITRDAGSAYKANTRDVRARDIQMLFADASTGSHSPALVRQGQISELINAKPKARRRILEEAAGISGLYQRRHEAELKLNGAEQNLSRVDDVIEQLATQLAQLARQARQAARYRQIGTDLRQAEGLLLYRRWREADELMAGSGAAHREIVAAAAAAERAVLAAEKQRAETDAALPGLREEEAIAAAVVQRLQVERGGLREEASRAEAAIDTLRARIEQMTRDIEREEGLNRDAGETVERLRWEAEELTKASDGHEGKLEEAMEAARQAAAHLQGVEEDLAEKTEDVARLAARHQSAQRMLGEARSAVDKHAGQAGDAMGQADAARDRKLTAEAAVEAAMQASEEAAERAEAAEAALEEADEARSELASREVDARSEASAAEGEAGALRAEMTALARLVAREAGEGEQVLDQISVDKGYEKALGAALADDLQAPSVDDEAPSGWVALPDYPHPQGLPGGIRPLADYMAVPNVLKRRMGEVGLVSGEEGAARQAELKPGQRLVSVEGDLWRWDGFRAGSDDAPTAAAMRLQQLNRLEELKLDLEEAEARALGAKQAHALLTADLARITEADRAARAARREADTAMAEASRALSRAESEASMAATRLEAAEMAVARNSQEAAEARQRLEEAEAAMAELPDLEAERAGVEEARAAVEDARREMLSRRAVQDEVRRMGEARVRRGQEITRDIANWEERLANAESRSNELADRKESMIEELEAAEAAPEEIEAREANLMDALEKAEARRKAAADALAEAESAWREAQAAEREAAKVAGELREGRAAAQARMEAAAEARQLAEERIREELECAPDSLLESLGVDPENMPSSEALENDLARLRRQRDALGAVNLRAEEDAKEVETEHGELVKEKADLEEAIRALRNGIAGLNKEGRERLLTAFEQVNSNFTLLFRHLFGGGEASLELVESDDPLDAGLEIMCMPPGKKLSTLSLLSGGEQTLTAMALIFAVFLANPAPICVLDEVDAPLDDANVTRFCDLLDEMTRRTDTRFLIITHHAVTMSRMDRLFGVTMQEQGVSQLVSVDLKKAEALVA
ncbi:AAA family ATPase [Vannielia sp.]|uniref:chromosome segregation SMC family protein n=1 Tax=Vannielia sp. TaxID=2813045 RepID=UPI00261B4B0D|nr:AAA family ATPase [Vannielia sp.]MDF1873806.1 AAA family ATPase [Vannielia sp.]